MNCQVDSRYAYNYRDMRLLDYLGIVQLAIVGIAAQQIFKAT